MERKVITIRRRTGEGVTLCDYCERLVGNDRAYDLYRFDINAEKEYRLKPVCSRCLVYALAYWSICGYEIKEVNNNA